MNNKNNPREVTHSAVLQIHRMIQSGELPKGQSLPAERELAKTLGISRGTLREALSVVRAQGLVSAEPNRRAVVIASNQAEPSGPLSWSFQRSLVDIFEFRFIIESQIAAIAAMNADEDDIRELAQLREAFREAVLSGERERIAADDEAFHTRIMNAAGNRVFEECYTYFHKPFRDTYGLEAEGDSPRQALIEHENISHAIEMRDPSRAAYFMRVHIMRAADRNGIALKKTPLAL